MERTFKATVSLNAPQRKRDPAMWALVDQGAWLAAWSAEKHDGLASQFQSDRLFPQGRRLQDRGPDPCKPLEHRTFLVDFAPCGACLGHSTDQTDRSQEIMYRCPEIEAKADDNA